MKNNSLSIILPVFNQAHCLETMVHALRKKFPKVEIIITEDGSTDGSLEKARALEKKGFVKVSHRKERNGKGAAIKRGLRMSRGNIVGFIDADMLEAVSTLPRFVKNAETFDSVIAVRNGKGSNRSFFRGILSKGYNALIALVFSINFSDMQCGCKFFSQKGKMIAESVECDNFAFDTELLVRANDARLRIVEIPIPYEEGEQTTASMKTTITKVVYLAKFAWKRFLKI